MKDQTKWEQLDAEGKAPCVHCLKPTVFGSGRFVNRLSWAGSQGEGLPYRDGYACAACMARECDYCMEDIALDEDLHSPTTGEGYYHSECLSALGFTEKQIEEGNQ